jgi:hypothetical protein
MSLNPSAIPGQSWEGDQENLQASGHVRVLSYMEAGEKGSFFWVISQSNLPRERIASSIAKSRVPRVWILYFLTGEPDCVNQ